MREFGLMGVFIRDIGLIWNESRRTKNNVKPADVLLLHKNLSALTNLNKNNKTQCGVIPCNKIDTVSW